MRVLVLTYRCPWPPTTGGDNRVWQHLQWLAAEHEVTLVSLAPAGGTIPEPLRALCAEVHFVPMSRTVARLRTLRALFSSIPLQVAYYGDRRFMSLVQRLTSERRFDLLYASLLRTAPAALQVLHVPRLLDYCDCLSMQLRRRAAASHGWRRAILALESRRLKPFEAQLAKQFDATIITSSIDATEVSRERTPFIVPVAVGDEPQVPSERNGELPSGAANVAFMGDMSTQYSEAAIDFFAREIWPAIRAARPDAVFWIVGKDPSLAVRRWVSPSIRVTGTVRSLRPYFERVQVAVAPLPIGSGVKTKVLQAMANGVPVVATPIAAEGMNARHGVELLIAQDAPSFASAVIGLLQSPALRDSVSSAARQYVDRNFGSEPVRRQFETAVAHALAAASTRFRSQESVQ